MGEGIEPEDLTLLVFRSGGCPKRVSHAPSERDLNVVLIHGESKFQ